MKTSQYRNWGLCFILALTLFTSYRVKAETNSPGFINITYLNGLTTDSVYDICTDQNGYVWIGTATGLSRYNGYNIKNFFKEEMNIRSNTIRYLLRDKRNRIWIGSHNGLGVWDNEAQKFLNLETMTGDAVENKSAGFFEDSEGTIWASLRTGVITAIDPENFSIRKHFFGTEKNDYFARIWFEPENDLYLAAAINGGLFYLDVDNDTKVPFTLSDNPDAAPFANRKIMGIVKTGSTSFCISCEDGTLWMINPYDRSCRQLPLGIKGQKQYKFRKVFVIGDNMIAIGHTTGLLIYDLEKERLVYNKITRELEGSNVYCVCGNLDTGLIIGTSKNGVIIQQESGFDFTTIKGNPGSKRPLLMDSHVTGFAQTNDTTIWVSTQLKGLFQYNSADRKIKRYNSHNLPKDLYGIACLNGKVWVRSSAGIYSLQPETGDVKSYREGYQGNKDLIVTKDGRLLVLTENRLLQFDEATDNFKPVKEFQDLTVLEIGRSDSNTLVAMTAEKGFVRWNGAKVTVTHQNPFSTESLPNLPVIIFEDNHALIWSTIPESGVISVSDSQINSLTTRSGLASDVISNIIKDLDENILITTDRSLTKITRAGKMYSITRSDGLINFGFSRSSAFRTSNGEILLGSRDGITIIHRSSKKKPAQPSSESVIDKIICNGMEIPVKSRNRAVLNHTQNNIDIRVFDVDPHHILSGRQLFCLEGYDNTWRPAGKDMKLSYQNLKSGKYILRSYNPDIEPLTIRIKSHPLTSVTAYVIYVLILLGLMSIIIIYIRGNEIRKRKEKTYQMKMDLHQEKLDFFTNIAHEIKTPLTLITTPLSHLTNNPNLDAEAKYDIEIMNKHASYLSTLIKELLEFSKIEKNKFNINLKPVDICSSTSNVIANFTDMNNRVKWQISVPEEPIWVMADTSATTKILNNLVFNAIKYSGSFISIDITRNDNGFAIVRIANDGDIIPQEMRSRIFDSFVRYISDNGTESISDGFGIGLSVAKTLAQKQNGELHMSDNLELNEFFLSIPLCNNAPVILEEEEEIIEDGGSTFDENLNGTILVVEDHPDLLEYLRKNMKRQYRVLTAENGAAALELIRKQSNIDLVVTDLKMPKMSGMDLCRNIKSDPTFSHILTVILSANLTPEAKVESMKIGVDAIVEKPFSMEFLISRVENLITSRKNLIQKISGNSNYEPKEESSHSGLTSRDIVFLQELKHAVEENYSNPEFGVDEIANLLNISRSSLNRKMRDILNTTANNYIRDRKIAKAEELLRTSTLQINEICYKVGFTTPSYFIKCFRKKYGMSPNEYANSIH